MTSHIVINFHQKTILRNVITNFNRFKNRFKQSVDKIST